MISPRKNIFCQQQIDTAIPYHSLGCLGRFIIKIQLVRRRSLISILLTKTRLVDKSFAFQRKSTIQKKCGIEIESCGVIVFFNVRKGNHRTRSIATTAIAIHQKVRLSMMQNLYGSVELRKKVCLIKLLLPGGANDDHAIYDRS